LEEQEQGHGQEGSALSEVHGRIQVGGFGNAQEQRQEFSADRARVGITAGLLLKWRDRYQVNSTGQDQVHLEPSDMQAAQAEIRRLQRELAQVEEERETPAA